MMFAPFRNAVRKRLKGVVEQTSCDGFLALTPWQKAVWIHQSQASVSISSKSSPFFSTTWNVYTGWREYHGYRRQNWLPSPEDAVQAARQLQCEGWEDVFICSTRLGLTGPFHRAVGNLEDPTVFARLALDLEREQKEGRAASLTASAFSNFVHLLYGPPAGIVRGLVYAVRFLISREGASWYEFWAILAWRFSGKASD